MLEEKEKQEIAKFPSKAPDSFWKYYPTLGQEIQGKFERKEESKQGVVLEIGQTCGRPLLLDVGLDSKLRAMIISLRTAGAGTKQHVVRRF